MTMAPPADDLLTPAEVAKRLGVGIKFVQRRTKTGEIPSYKIGRAVRISAADLDAWMADRYSATSEPEPDEPVAAPAPAGPRRVVRRRPPPST